MKIISIRQAIQPATEHVAALLNSYRQFYEQPAALSLVTRFISNRILNNESVILVAETEDSGGKVILGFCSVLAKPMYTLYDLFVAPDARKTGASRALLRAAHKHAKAHGFARLDLSTAKNNLAAQALYEPLGWVRDDVYFSYSKTI